MKYSPSPYNRQIQENMPIGRNLRDEQQKSLCKVVKAKSLPMSYTSTQCLDPIQI